MEKQNAPYKTREHMRDYIIRSSHITGNDSVDIVSVYGSTDNDVVTMVGHTSINIDRKTAAHILRANRKSGAKVYRAPLYHSAWCPCNHPR